MGYSEDAWEGDEDPRGNFAGAVGEIHWFQAAEILGLSTPDDAAVSSWTGEVGL